MTTLNYKQKVASKPKNDSNKIGFPHEKSDQMNFIQDDFENREPIDIKRQIHQLLFKFIFERQ